MNIEPWRQLVEYVGGSRNELSNLLKKESGIYLLARPTRPDFVSIKDIVYIGLAGEAAGTNGTFQQRVKSHAAKLRSGKKNNPGCPAAWASYYDEFGGNNADRSHALRLIRMENATPLDKHRIGEWEDILLLLWGPMVNSQSLKMPTLNTKRPDITLLRTMLEGPIEKPLTPHKSEPTPRPLLPVDEIADLWESDDSVLEQKEKLAQYEQFFDQRDKGDIWRHLKTDIEKKGYNFRVINLRTTKHRPGQLRLSRIQPGAERASGVYALLVPDENAVLVDIELRLEPEVLPAPHRANATSIKHGAMRSKFRVSMSEVASIMQLAIDHADRRS